MCVLERGHQRAVPAGALLLLATLNAARVSTQPGGGPDVARLLRNILTGHAEPRALSGPRQYPEGGMKEEFKWSLMEATARESHAGDC